MASIQFNTDFPSKNYTRYRSESKTNPLLTKLNSDIGYPEGILNVHKNVQKATHKNYLQLNKKNLKNFFADRLPPKDVKIIRQSFTIDPTKLFEIKRKHQEQRNITKSAIDQKINQTMAETKLKANRISENFSINDKNKEFKEKFLNNTLYVTKPYQTNNFLRGTESYVYKYNIIPKKRAYNSVFGPQASATPSKASKMESDFAKTARPSAFTFPRENKRETLIGSKGKQTQRKKFSSMIAKIDGYRQAFDPENRCGIKPYSIPKDVEENQQDRTEVLSWLRDLTINYKNQKLGLGKINVKEIRDIEKIDNKFYQQMQTHKAKRLQKRENIVKNSRISNQRHSNISKLTEYNGIKQSTVSENFLISDRQDQQIVQYLGSDEGNKTQRWRNSTQIFQLLCKSVIKSMKMALLYGIDDKFKIFKAFYRKPEPYQKSGSYAFFKAIKNGQLEGVKKFVQIDPDFVYERDYKGRNGLIYATIHNQLGIVKYLLTCGINPNFISNMGKTSLYYAMKNQNIQIVKVLLRSAADPWSTPSCSYQNLLISLKNEEIRNLFKNARRVYIAIQMKRDKKEKLALWNNLKSQINQFSINTSQFQ